ncbi:MAG: hypothetical protein PUP46_04415 [Endozoicomonas sp. (ex Botrylloides leachii)]|nr:hypothetical protein [Endozoicomonas sp. (ex Botrylloides leachii)]
MLLGEKHNLTGQIFCGLPQFTKQALSIRTNEQADPIEILGLTKSVWEVSPQILLNNPDIKIPFFNKNIDGKKCINGFIPVRNTGRGVEEQSEGILVPLKDECLLFTLTAEKKWRCQSFGNDFNSEQHSEQKYIGYATLAMAYSAQRGNDEAVKGALIQAYQEWCDYNRSDENGLNKFIEKITDELRKIKNSSVWINVKDREEALKDCLRNLKDEFKENNKNKIKGYATDLSKVTGFIVHKGMDDIHSEPNKAISRLSNKLSSKSTKAEEEYKKKSAFASRSAKDGGGFFSPKVSHGFTLYDKEFIKTLKENRPSESKLFSFMSTYRDKFISDFIGTLSGFSDVVIDDNIDKANLTDNIKSIDRIISKLNFEKINLKGERARLYQGVKKYLVKADTNISDIDDAKRLWVQGRIPSGLNDKDKDIYIETMHHLTQVSWIENTLHQHIDKLCKHKGKIEKLKREKIDITNRITFQNAARQLNGELAKIKNSFDELNDLINNKKNMSYASDPARSLLGFMESRNIQLRKNQVDVVPKLLEEQSNAIRDEKPTRLFLMEGTGGGKTLCMEAMVDNALNSLTKKDNQFKITHPVMVIAPDTNEAQLRSSLAVAEGQKGRVIKVMQPVLKNLTDKYGKETFTKEESLRKIYNLLLGVDINTIADDLNNQVGSRRSACLLSFSSFQLLLHATESALLVTNLTPESKELLNLIRDLFSNGIIFGDECVSGPLPYTAYDEDRIIQNIKNTMVGLDSNNVTPDSACKKAIGVMSNCFLFTGLSATKGSAAIGALFAGSSTYEETAKKLNENIKTTRLRAFDRLSEGKVVLSKDNKNEMAAKMVANLGSNRGIIILDTVTRETANKGENSFHMKLATEWQESLKSARDSNKDKSTEKQVVLTTSYIDGDGNTMLYDPDRLEYSGKDETRLGAVINPSDATSLKNSGARTHDSILGYDQGIGSDPIQGEQTAFVITGLFGAAEHGRSDLVEQWAGRGTRASSEPYNRQDILLMVTTSELDEIINSDSSSRAMKKYAKDCKLCADKLDEAKTKLDQVLENESLSESIRSKIQSSINTRLHIEHNSEDGINDIKNKIKQEANQVSSYLIQDLKEVISDKTTLNKIEKAVNKYLIAEELFQLETHLLLFNAMAQRENNAFTARHESWAFEGDKEYFLQKMYAKQEHWARNESAEFKNKYGGEIKLLVDSEFNKTVIGDKSKLESSTHGKLMEYVAAIIKLDYVIKKTKDNSSFGISAQDVSRRSEEVLKLYKFGNANILNNDNIKAMLTNIADNTSWVRHKDEIKNYFVHYKKAKEAYEKTAVILDNYSKDYPTREFVKDNMTESFEQVLSNITRVSLRGYEKSEELLESTVARPNFLNKLSSELDTAVNKSGEDFTTSMLTLERGKFVKLDVATINFKLEAKIYAESINKILDDIRKKVGGKEIFNGFLSGKFIGLENDVNEFLENIDNIDSYEFESRFNIIKNSISDYLFELSNDVFFGAKDVSVGTSKVDGILYSIIKLFKGPEFNTNTPTIKQRVNGHGYIENGFCIGKPTAGEEKPVSLITIIKDSVTIELPRKLIEARDSYRKQRAEVAALKTRDKLFAEKLKQKGQEIKNKILEDYRNSCQTNLKEQARNKDRLRQEQEKMKLL